ncbi:HEXXH motif domain-containing protein [Streptomyces sp. NBC_01262]|uniref:HEXXH motif domain-containing protein n=1 Tax=Streptomyces sp. NBC_01262 TaxID=2903803 RepID=UPI002E31A044|nr:HEXXH motif domain-containing protein [Streptomyces sp. NBC_01262]
MITASELRELGRTHGTPALLTRLVAGQRTRRLLLLRALLDAAAVLPPAAARRLHDHWSLLETADRAAPDAVREVLHYPLVGPWAERSLRLLTAPTPAPHLSRDLSHLGALAASAAARAAIPFTLHLPAPDGLLSLPTMGAVRCSAAAATVTMPPSNDRLTITPDRGRPLVIHRRPRGTWRSPDPRWRPLHHFASGSRFVPLDDLDPYRAADSDMETYGLSAAQPLSAHDLDNWRDGWHNALPMLHIGDGQRAVDLERLLFCVVPLDPPPTASRERGHCSGTRRETFGAVLSSTPLRAGYLAATMVHELQHAKLGALAHLVPLHTADGQPCHWAPWRPDPRPFEGLLQGAYSHLALAEYWQAFALDTKEEPLKEHAWAEHSRCREQVGAVLPTLLGSRSLTEAGRVLMTEMAAHLGRLKDIPPPSGHLVRAAAYVQQSRRVWRLANG